MGLPVIYRLYCVSEVCHGMKSNLKKYSMIEKASGFLKILVLITVIYN